jgi:hypothetical protein
MSVVSEGTWPEPIMTKLVRSEKVAFFRRGHCYLTEHRSHYRHQIHRPCTWPKCRLQSPLELNLHFDGPCHLVGGRRVARLYCPSSKLLYDSECLRRLISIFPLPGDRVVRRSRNLCWLIEPGCPWCDPGENSQGFEWLLLTAKFFQEF